MDEAAHDDEPQSLIFFVEDFSPQLCGHVQQFGRLQGRVVLKGRGTVVGRAGDRPRYLPDVCPAHFSGLLPRRVVCLGIDAEHRVEPAS